MANKDHSFKRSKRKAKAYRRLLKEVTLCCNVLGVTEEKACFKVMVGEASQYVSMYKLERALYAKKQLELSDKF